MVKSYQLDIVCYWCSRTIYLHLSFELCTK